MIIYDKRGMVSVCCGSTNFNALFQVTHAQYASDREFIKTPTFGVLVRKFDLRIAVAGVLMTAAVLVCEVCARLQSRNDHALFVGIDALLTQRACDLGLQWR